MSLTTQSESVPLVEAMRLAMGWPLIFIGAVSVSETKEMTSGRPETPRWSSTSHCFHGTFSAKPTGWLGRPLKGTGLAGSETYSSKAAPPAAGPGEIYLNSAVRESGVGFTLQPPAQPAGQAWRPPPGFLPGSNVGPGAMLALGPAAFKKRPR